jgi:hypothetical protein
MFAVGLYSTLGNPEEICKCLEPSMSNRYQRTARKPNRFEVVAGRELEVRMPLVEVWEELQAEVERLTGEAEA